MASDNVSFISKIIDVSGSDYILGKALVLHFGTLLSKAAGWNVLQLRGGKLECPKNVTDYLDLYPCYQIVNVQTDPCLTFFTFQEKRYGFRILVTI